MALGALGATEHLAHHQVALDQGQELHAGARNVVDVQLPDVNRLLQQAFHQAMRTRRSLFPDQPAIARIALPAVAENGAEGTDCLGVAIQVRMGQRDPQQRVPMSASGSKK